jgi:hypothetical protein
MLQTKLEVNLPFSLRKEYDGGSSSLQFVKVIVWPVTRLQIKEIASYNGLLDGSIRVILSMRFGLRTVLTRLVTHYSLMSQRKSALSQPKNFRKCSMIV